MNGGKVLPYLMTLPTLAVRIGKGLYELSRDGKAVMKKANVARLKIYTKRAGEDETSGPSAKKGKVHRIAKYNVLYVSCIYFYICRVQTKGPILMEVESQSQEDSSQTLNVVEHQNPRHFPLQEKCKFCLIVTFKPYCDSLIFSLLQASEYWVRELQLKKERVIIDGGDAQRSAYARCPETVSKAKCINLQFLVPDTWFCTSCKLT